MNVVKMTFLCSQNGWMNVVILRKIRIIALNVVKMNVFKMTTLSPRAARMKIISIFILISCKIFQFF